MRAFGRDVVMNSRRYYRDRITDPRCLLITYPRGMIRVVGIPNRIAPIFPANPIEFRPLPHQIFVLFVRKGIRFSRFRFLKRWFDSSYGAESPPVTRLDLRRLFFNRDEDDDRQRHSWRRFPIEIYRRSSTLFASREANDPKDKNACAWRRSERREKFFLFSSRQKTRLKRNYSM